MAVGGCHAPFAGGLENVSVVLSEDRLGSTRGLQGIFKAPVLSKEDLRNQRRPLAGFVNPYWLRAGVILRDEVERGWSTLGRAAVWIVSCF